MVHITENPAAQIVFIHLLNDDSNANISLYTLSCPELKFRLYLRLKVVYAIIVSPFSNGMMASLNKLENLDFP